jgi:hypothetical protein
MKNFVFAWLLFAAATKALAQPQPGTVLWTYVAGVPIQSSPVLAQNGTTYIIASGLEEVTNNGVTASNKWSFPAGGSLPYVGAPAVSGDGTIYAVSGGLFALNPSGTQKWAYPAVNGQGSPAIGLDNTIYFVAAGFLHSVSPAGAKKWDYDIGGASSVGVHSPVIGPEGTIYVGLEGFVYALSPSGTNKWFLHKFGWGGGTASPAIAGDRTVYFSIGYLLPFTPEGTNLWALGGYFGSPIIGKSGTTYVSDGVRSLHAISPQGQIQWQTNLGKLAYGGNPTAPAIDAGGRIYYCVSNSVWALNPQGQVLWHVASSESIPPDTELANTSPTIGPDGTLYAAIGRTLYAIATGTNGPANSPWPMDRQNARHTGKVEKPALRQPQKRSDANFQFQLYGQLGQTFTVEATTNFNTWTSVTSFVANTLPVDVVDLSASNHPSRFYRASSPP